MLNFAAGRARRRLVTNARSPSASPPRQARRKWRSWWMKQLHTWHWMSAGVSLIGMLAFAITGITLNHAATIGATPVVTDRAATLPPALRRQLGKPPASDAPLPAPVAAAVARAVGLDPAGRPGEWSDTDVSVAMPRPGGDAWVSIDRASGRITSEVTQRGWIAYLNDLHKGRNAGPGWGWFIDIFAVACILFTLTGLLLLQLHARNRRATWPIVAAGFVIPIVVIVLFVH
ncbi:MULTISPECIES: PepSY-associated TM helix domain-containing protein [unclassified Sphingomonas]|uniref:PepSY-associated TM helix domain-containing protein n=1 Tax=unclassified Sphingomonas TaxID=196159 RepID=UPI002269977E|nr:MULTISPECIES: PepSY-associated TM helix domain-containing protein [unclassified Sphingomonas]